MINLDIEAAFIIIAAKGLTPCQNTSYETKRDVYAFSVEDSGDRPELGAKMTVCIDKETQRIFIKMDSEYSADELDSIAPPPWMAEPTPHDPYGRRRS